MGSDIVVHLIDATPYSKSKQAMDLMNVWVSAPVFSACQAE